MSSCTTNKATRALTGLAILSVANANSARPTSSNIHSRIPIPVRSQNISSSPSSTAIQRQQQGPRSHSLRPCPLLSSKSTKQESAIIRHVERIRASRTAHSAKTPSIPWPSTKRTKSPVTCGPRVPQTLPPQAPLSSNPSSRQVSATTSVATSNDSAESTESSIQRELELLQALKANPHPWGFGKITKQPCINTARVEQSVSAHIQRIQKARTPSSNSSRNFSPNLQCHTG